MSRTFSAKPAVGRRPPHTRLLRVVDPVFTAALQSPMHCCPRSATHVGR